jgi:hypothetical protein
MGRRISPERMREILTRAYGLQTPTLDRYFKRVFVPFYIKDAILSANRKLGRTKG